MSRNAGSDLTIFMQITSWGTRVELTILTDFSQIRLSKISLAEIAILRKFSRLILAERRAIFSSF